MILRPQRVVVPLEEYLASDKSQNLAGSASVSGGLDDDYDNQLYYTDVGRRTLASFV
jgi:hypothetical protein